MTDSATESAVSADGKTQSEDAELVAIQTLLSALSRLDEDQRQRVIDYVFQRLGLAAQSPHAEPPPPATPPPSSMAQGAHPAPSAQARDIRSLKELKKPRSANEMAALVAYYLAEVAPEALRKGEIGTDDITTYFKQAGYPLPSVLRNTLVNAKASGYFDSAAHGLYRLNPVGHNLIVHGLPSGGDDGRSKSRPSRGAKRPAKSKAAKRK